MQPIIYSSLDAGAPQLSATAGALNTVLKGCLVTGYGDKLAAGWEVVHEDMATHKLVLRSSNVQKNTCVVELTNTNKSYASVTAYSDWDDLSSSGVAQFGTGYIVNNYESPTPRWAVIATDSFCYVYIQSHTGTNTYVLSAFGTAISHNATNDIAILMAASNTVYSYSYFTPNTVKTNMGDAKFPILPYKHQNDYGFGDWASVATSGIAILSGYVLYVNAKPLLSLPGALMPYAQIARWTWSSIDNNMATLVNQEPFLNDVVAFWVPYVGRFWIHTDDWG